jgi:hypothetical protein
MRMRENRPTIKASLSTTTNVVDREHLVRLIFERLGKQGLVVTDEMVYITHYGFDDRIDWDDHIIVVDGHGVFGFTDQPCPSAGIKHDRDADELSSAYGVDR